MTLMKNIMADMALRSSWRETKGHRNQLMTTALTVPTRKATPWATAMMVGDWFPMPLLRAREMTVKEMQPATPERWGRQLGCNGEKEVEYLRDVSSG